MDIANATLSDFSGTVNSRYSVMLGGAEDDAQPIEVELIEAGDVSQQAMGDAKLECFALLFKGGLESRLPQGLHRFSHQQLGEFELFVTPIQHRDQDARYYEAVINRVCE